MALWFSLEFDGDGARHRPLADPKSIDLVWKVTGKSRKLKVRPRGSAVSLVMEVGSVVGDGQVIPVQILPPGASPSKPPTGAALGLHSGGSLHGIDLHGVALVGGRLDQVTLNDVRLDRAQLADVDLHLSTFSKVDLRDAVMTNARLDGVTWENVTLDRAQMVGANCRRATLSGPPRNYFDVIR